jgi:hypothetical protein
MECKDACIHINYLRDIFEDKLEAADKALGLASENIKIRLVDMNHVKEETRLLLPRTEYYIEHQRLIEDIRMLREARSELLGKASQSAVDAVSRTTNTALLISILGILLVVIDLVMTIIKR